MSNDQFIYWHSKDGMDWVLINVEPRSIVAWHLGQIPIGEIYDDGYGNRYRCDKAVKR